MWPFEESGVDQQVLVSGASFAGLATSFWLARLGYRVMVIEVAKGLRRGGTPVDIEGEAVSVLDRMNLLASVKSKALPPRRLQFKSEGDQAISTIEPEPAASGGRLEIHRDDLLDILFGAVEGVVEMRFNCSIRELSHREDSVAVTLEDDTRRSFAMVFGCDGNRSRTRRLVFGENGYSHFLGGYFCLKVVSDTTLLPVNLTEVYSAPGVTALLNGYEDRTDIGFGFRSRTVVDYDYRDRAQQRAMIHRHFDRMGWKVPAMLRHLDADDNFYFDQLNQIRMPIWSKGRVALVGDAGYCVSPLAGMGGSMALIGASRLADALQSHAHDYQSAFREYHDKLHRFVDEVQEQAATSGMAMMFPMDWQERVRDRR